MSIENVYVKYFYCNSKECCEKQQIKIPTFIVGDIQLQPKFSS